MRINENGAKGFTPSDARRSSLALPQNNVFMAKSTEPTNGDHLRLVTARFIAEHIAGLSRSSGTIVAITDDPL
jgi:hypothetical protein